MNNSLRETMCARMALVPDLQTQNNDAIECKISLILQEARELLKDIRSAKIGPLEAAKVAMDISSSANALHDALKCLNERVKFIYDFLSEIESTLGEKTQ